MWERGERAGFEAEQVALKEEGSVLGYATDD